MGELLEETGDEYDEELEAKAGKEENGFAEELLSRQVICPLYNK